MEGIVAVLMVISALVAPVVVLMATPNRLPKSLEYRPPNWEVLGVVVGLAAFAGIWTWGSSYFPELWSDDSAAVYLSIIAIIVNITSAIVLVIRRIDD
jgi:hypothetical protein